MSEVHGTLVDVFSLSNQRTVILMGDWDSEVRVNAEILVGEHKTNIVGFDVPRSEVTKRWKEAGNSTPPPIGLLLVDDLSAQLKELIGCKILIERQKDD